MSKDDMEKFEEHEMKKITPIIRNWFDLLIKQSVMGKKPIIITDKLRDKIINEIQRLSDTEKEKEKRKKKKQNVKIIKDNMIRDIRIPFDHEKEEVYYEPKMVNIFGIIITSSMKVMVMKKEPCHLMNILTKLKLT